MAMELVGMLDSPFVRRVAISMSAMKLAFKHEPLSVFNDLEAMQAVNPLMKAPSLITEEGLLLIDSTLILEYLDRKCDTAFSLNPADINQFTMIQHLVGIALTICDKAVQLFYETHRRPVEKQYQEWTDRIVQQLKVGLELLDKLLMVNGNGYIVSDRISQAEITIAVGIKYLAEKLPEYYQQFVSEKLKQFALSMEDTVLFSEYKF